MRLYLLFLTFDYSFDGAYGFGKINVVSRAGQFFEALYSETPLQAFVLESLPDDNARKIVIPKDKAADCKRLISSISLAGVIDYQVLWCCERQL
ncbi:MAG: hypothetical protein R3C24_03000 [Cyanobacteriota/Melainabacteria group bacterium]